MVELGAKKRYAAVVVQVQTTPPDYETKPVLELLEDAPSVHPSQLALWFWMADYYLCSVGEVMTAALPAALRPSSETEIHYTGVDWEEASTTPAERPFLLQLQRDGRISGKGIPARTVERWVA